MALPIITAVRARHDLKESVFHTLIELAHRSSIYGVVRVSLRYLAQKCHCCKQTIINHIAKLIELKILSKNVVWIKGNLCETNTYRFLIAWQKSPAHMCHSQNSGPKFPHQEKREENCSGRNDEQGKEGSLREKLANQKRMLPILYTPGSDQWNRTCEEIAYLEGLLASSALPVAG
jgi:hypothetical protein